MVGEAQRSRAPIQRLADIVSRASSCRSSLRSPLVTFVVWALVGPEPRLAHALVNAVAVLIIACPCALGLATPMSIMVGTGTRRGRPACSVRNAEALEVLEKVDTLVVDKTGTLTEGKPRADDRRCRRRASPSNDVLRTGREPRAGQRASAGAAPSWPAPRARRRRWPTSSTSSRSRARAWSGRRRRTRRHRQPAAAGDAGRRRQARSTAADELPAAAGRR